MPTCDATQQYFLLSLYFLIGISQWIMDFTVVQIQRDTMEHRHNVTFLNSDLNTFEKRYEGHFLPGSCFDKYLTKKIKHRQLYQN